MVEARSWLIFFGDVGAVSTALMPVKRLPKEVQESSSLGVFKKKQHADMALDSEIFSYLKDSMILCSSNLHPAEASAWEVKVA